MGDPDPAPAPAATLGEAIRLATAALAEANGCNRADASSEAEILLGIATGLARTTLIAWPERRLDDQASDRFQALLARRIEGHPIAYLRGSQGFWDLELRVTPATLIPRPETELLVEIALSLCADDIPGRAVDLGTGSGAIAGVLGSHRPGWQVIAIDRYAGAICVAAANLRALGLANVLPVRGDWLRALAPGALDLIVANPPYVADGDPHLARGDLRFEPRRALASGADGLDAIRDIAAQAPRCLAPGAWIALEHGFDQGGEVRRILARQGLIEIETHRDLAGHERITRARRPGRPPLGAA